MHDEYTKNFCWRNIVNTNLLFFRYASVLQKLLNFWNFALISALIMVRHDLSYSLFWYHLFIAMDLQVWHLMIFLIYFNNIRKEMLNIFIDTRNLSCLDKPSAQGITTGGTDFLIRSSSMSVTIICDCLCDWFHFYTISIHINFHFVIGQQARDALLLIMQLSHRNEPIAKYIVENTNFCPVDTLNSIYERVFVFLSVLFIRSWQQA